MFFDVQSDKASQKLHRERVLKNLHIHLLSDVSKKLHVEIL